MTNQRLDTAGGANLELVFWPSCVMHLPLSDQLDVAAAGGFNTLAIAPTTVKRELSAIRGRPSDLLEMAGERGIALNYLDGVSTWVSAWYPTVGDAGINKYMYDRMNVSMEEALDIGQSLGITSAVAVGAFDKGAVPRDELVDSFGTFCDAGKRRGISIDLEFIPLWGIPELTDAWDIVKTADRQNASIVVDTWHMQKGTASFERDISLLEEIPARYLRHVQLADAPLHSAGDTLFSDLALRTFPGWGELDIGRMLSVIEMRGSLLSVGPEVVGSVLDGLSLKENGEQSGISTRKALAEARAWKKSTP